MLAKRSGAKRYIVTDTLRNVPGLIIHPADVQNRDGAPVVLKSIRTKHSRLGHVFADGGYAGLILEGRLEKIVTWTLQVVKRSDYAIGFELLLRRWAEAAKVSPAQAGGRLLEGVERPFAWLGRCRRLAKDFGATVASAAAWVLLAHIPILTR
jgi:transposase